MKKIALIIMTIGLILWGFFELVRVGAFIGFIGGIIYILSHIGILKNAN